MNTFVEIPASKMSIAKRTTIFGIGINDACYQVQPFINGKQVTCPFYRVWKNMMKRCYSKKLQEQIDNQLIVNYG